MTHDSPWNNTHHHGNHLFASDEGKEIRDGVRTPPGEPEPPSSLTRLRRWLWLAGVAGVVLWLSGCGGKPVGAACVTNDECSRGLFCDPGVMGGYCTALCGQALPCPGLTICTPIEGTDPDNNPVLITRCLQPCGLPTDCRAGLQCQALTAGQQRVCFVAPAGDGGAP